MRRGWVREAMLALLVERPMHGYEMISELTARVGGTWRPSPGTIYPTLQALENEGLVTALAEGGRRSYSLTEAGRRLAAASSDRPSPWEGFHPPPDNGEAPLRAAVGHLLGAVEHVVLSGTADQKVRTAEVLTQARQAVYAVLAETPSD